MNIDSIQFDFSPIGRNRKSINRSAITGLTMTVYDSRFSLTTDVLGSLGNPSHISVAYEPRLEAFLVFEDDDGYKVERASSGGKTYRCMEVKEILQNHKNCDFAQNFYRLQNGRRYGQYVIFSTDDMIEIKREVRNGK